MLLPLPAPPHPPACSLLRPAPLLHLLSPAAASPPLLPTRLLRSRASPFRAQLTSPSPTSGPLPFAFSFPASSPGTSFQRNNNPAANGGFKAEEEEESVVGDCLVFEEGAFEGGDPFLPPCPDADGEGEKKRKTRRRKPDAGVNAEDLVPEKWREMLAEINLTKKEKRKISQELKFGSRVERRKKLPVPDLEEYRAYRAMKLAQLKPVVLDNPRKLPPPPPEEEDEEEVKIPSRVSPRNPRLAIGDASLEVISDFFNSSEYVPRENDDDKKPGKRKLFTKDEKVLLNKRIPNLADATSSKWLPLHTLAMSGEFYLLDALLEHSVDVNAPDKDGLCAIHKAILGNKVAIVNYLLKESANPFVRDQDGATLLHYAVLTTSSPIIKILLLYDVNINLPDHDGWTPLHLAVQTVRTDVVRLLLIKGADKTLKNKDGLTPLDLCLYSGQNSRTYELIKLLKELPKLK